MPLQYIDRHVIGAIIADAWQNQLQTEIDPADGQWFANGPNNNGGLYGMLTDALATELVFDMAQQSAPNRTQAAAATALADNRNGLTPEQTVTLAYSYTDSTATTHGTTKAIKAGISSTVKGKWTLLSKTEVEFSTTVSTDYTHSWNDSTTTTKSETRTFTQQVPVRGIPAGRIYQVVLLANKEELSVPYRADIYLTGTTTASFASPVQGQRFWTVDAGTLCEWIARHGSAGADSWLYARDPENPTRGRISVRGTLKAAQTINFSARTSDVTDSYLGAPGAPVVRDAPGTLVTPGQVIAETPLAA